MRLGIIKEITIKELKAHFDHMSGYILISMFLGLVYFFFLKTFYISGVVSMRSMFEILPWFLAIFVPAITMGSFASELEKQTFEYLETKPIKQIELIIGKILGATKIISIAILLTLPLPFLISRIGPLDIGETVAGYFAAILLTFALSSMGVAISTFYKNQIAAFITSVVVALTLLIINSDITAINLPTTLANSLAQFSIIDNYAPIVRGVITLKNIVYFVIFIITSITIAYTNIQKVRISSTTQLYKKTFATIILVAFAGAGLVYLSDYFGQQVGRIDLTSDKRYTLSKATTDILHEDGKIIIEVFASDNLPPVYNNAYEEIKNLLADYKSAAGSNLEIRYLDPKKNGERISTLEVQPVQFNTVGEDQIQLQEGYLALVIMNEDESKKEKADYIQSINDLEYQLTSSINKIKSDSKPAVGFVSGNGEKGIFTEYSYLGNLLQSEYDIRTVFLKSAKSEADTEKSEAKPEDPNLSQYKLLVIAGPEGNYDDASLEYIADYINSGGNVIYLADNKNIDLDTGEFKDYENTGRVLEQFGATVNNDTAYDLQNGLQIPISDQITTKYAYFIISNRDANAAELIQYLPERIIYPWGATLNLDSSWQWLFATSQQGGKTVGPISLDPQAELPEEALGYTPLIALRKTEAGGTIVIAGSSRIFEDQFASISRENAVFALALFENMAKGKGLSEIKSKNLMGSQFSYVTTDVKGSINYGAPITSAVLLILVGASRIYRKRKLAQVYA